MVIWKRHCQPQYEWMANYTFSFFSTGLLFLVHTNPTATTTMNRKKNTDPRPESSPNAYTGNWIENRWIFFGFSSPIATYLCPKTKKEKKSNQHMHRQTDKHISMKNLTHIGIAIMHWKANKRKEWILHIHRCIDFQFLIDQFEPDCVCMYVIYIYIYM